jgi:hypothetical protein
LPDMFFDVRAVLKRSNIPLAGLTMLISFLMLGGFNVARGLSMGGDSHGYDEQSNRLVTEYLSGNHSTPTDTSNPSTAFYRGFWVFIAFFKIAFLVHWKTAFLLGVALLYALGCGGLFLAGSLYGNRRWMPGFALYCAIVPILYPEVYFLGNYLLADVSLGGLSYLAFTCIGFSFFREKISFSGACVSLALLALLLFWKPTMISVVAISILIVAARLVACYTPSRRFFIPFVAVYVVGSIAVLIIGALLRRNPELCPLEGVRVFFYNTDVVFKHGSLLDETSYWTVTPPKTPWEYIRLAIFRYIYVYRYWNPLHSVSHQLYSHLYFIPIFLLSIVHLARTFATWSQASSFVRWFTVYGLMIIHSLATSCALSVTAWEFRYQIPMFFFLWIFAFFGLLNTLVSLRQNGLSGSLRKLFRRVYEPKAP